MKLTFLGGADEVGASCTLVEISGKRLLIDSGIRISPKTSRGIQGSQLPDLQPISALGGFDYLLVTHAHTDHTGALPLVVGQFPHVPVIMTRPTEALTRVLQKDAQRIMSSHYETEGELPLYDEVSVDRLMNAIQLVEFNQALKLGEALQVTYHVSGHIIGAGMLVIESDEGTLVMSGDVSKSPQRTVESVRVPRIKADALVLESTYGGRLHANREAEERRLMDTLIRVIERGGKVLIPAFAIGRAQEVIQIIHAYRDKFEAPVYVDGMVRSVCDAYSRFSDLVPSKMVSDAGKEHLFFRNKVKPILTTAMRDEIAQGATPCVVIASSGMLTGGASQYYAKYFAPDERNAILLTGYQDEESPGKLLQRIAKEREAGEVPVLKLDKDVVPVRCEVGTYSLSAHADEDELVSIARALAPQEVMLVHGDASARHSLATALRQRQFITSTPKIGTTRELSFRKKAWGVGSKLSQGGHTEDFKPAQVWEQLKGQAGDYFSARELAQVWWGAGERESEVISLLSGTDNIYFAADWRNKSTYRVNSPAQVARHQRLRAIMLAHPDLVGKLVVLRNSNQQARLGVVRSADIDSFEAEVAGAQGSHFPADALVWVIGTWSSTPSAKGTTKVRLQDLLKRARAAQDTLLPFSTRQRLVNEAKPINPAHLLPADPPEGLDIQTALTAIVLALTDDHATLEQGGLRPQRAIEGGVVEQNLAREVAMNTFPPEARLRKVGIEVHRKRLTLTFDFPQVAEQRYAELIEQIIQQTGWDVEVKQQINQMALSSAVLELLPPKARIVKGPSIFMDRQEISAEIDGLSDPQIFANTYLSMTGFKLNLGKTAPSSASDAETAGQGNAKPIRQMEINAAYGLLRVELEALGLYKTSLKHGQIVLSFISPQVGARHADKIADLAKKIGYSVLIHEQANQHMIGMVVRQLLIQAGLTIRKGPSLYLDRACISLSLNEEASPEQLSTLQQEVLEQTGWTLEILP